MAGCNTPICNVKSGGAVQVQADFVAPFNATFVVPTVRVAFGLLPFFISYNLNIANACPLLTGAQCPLMTNDVSTFNLNFPISPSYPQAEFAIELTLRDEANNAMVCGVMDFVITG